VVLYANSPAGQLISIVRPVSLASGRGIFSEHVLSEAILVSMEFSASASAI